MPLRIQRSPWGLSGFLKIFGGQTPFELEDRVRAVVDVSDMYASPLLINSSGAPTVAALTPTLQETVSLTTTLGVRAISVALTIGAAAATNISLAWGYSISGGALITLGCHFLAQANAGNVIRAGCWFPRQVMPAGSVFWGEASGTAAGADHALSVVATLENYLRD